MKQIKISGVLDFYENDESMWVNECNGFWTDGILACNIAYMLYDKNMVDFTRKHDEEAKIWYQADCLTNVSLHYKIAEIQGFPIEAEKTIDGTLEIVVTNQGYSEWTIMSSKTEKFSMDGIDLEELFKNNTGKNIEITITKEE